MRIRLLAVLLPLAVCGSASPPPSAPPPLKAMAYNVLYSAPPKDVEKSLDVIDQEKPDVLCLRELTPAFSRAFEKRLGKDYPHRRLESRKGSWGVGIATRHRLLRTEVFPQRPHRMPAMEADVRVQGHRLKVVCAHLMAPGSVHRKGDSLLEAMPKNAELRAKQGAALVKRYAKVKGPLLLLGDMNEGRTGDAMRAFAVAEFAHACDGPNESCGPTWPGATTVLPAVVEIDHILGRGLALSDARVLHSGGSDHFPVQATFAFTP